MTMIVEQYESIETFKNEMHKNSVRKMFYLVNIKQEESKEEPPVGVQATAMLVMAAAYKEEGADRIMLVEAQIADGALASQKDMDDFNEEVKVYTTDVIAAIQKEVPALSGRIFKGSMRVLP